MLARKWICGVVLLMICAVFPLRTFSAPAQEAPEKILFLHLKWKNDVVTIEKAVARPGHFKEHPARGDVGLELLSADGATLWNTVIADPTIEHLEYEDPDHPGQLKVKIIQRAEAEFDLRVPFHSGAKMISFSRGAKSGAAGRKLLGTLDLPAVEVGK